VRLAIGALEREVLLQFLIESIMLACFGGIVGVVIALVASVVLTQVMNIPFIFDIGINVLAFGFAALIGIIFGYFPARRAAKLDPIEAVRHE
jgi:putative ABC transport system permease protein